MSLASITTYRRRLVQRRRAGRRARSRYQELRAAWLRQNRGRLAVVAVALLAIAASMTAFDRLWYGRFGVLTGLTWGAVTTAWMALRNSPPGFIENWQQGAWGEQFTADELAKLPEARWIAVHDIAHGGGNMDHVLAGPPGILLLDSKKYDGVVHIEGDDLVVTRDVDPSLRYRDRGRLSVIRKQAAAVSAELRERNGRGAWVEPVIVVWSTFPERVQKRNGVTVVHGRELCSWLSALPPRGGDATSLIECLSRGGA